MMKMNADFISEQKKVKQWLEQVIKAKTVLINLDANSLNDAGVELCGCNSHSVHMFSGVERVAFYLGVTVKYNPRWDLVKQRGYMSFYYKGFEVFQLWDIGSVKKEGA